MRRAAHNHPFFRGMGAMALLFFLSVGLWSFGTDLWTGGRPISDLGPSDRALLEKIDEEAHTPEEFCGANASPVFPTTAADSDTKTPFVLTGGNDTWGAWLHMIGSTDLPVRTGKVAFDIHEVFISSVSTASAGKIQIGWDLTTSSVILANETYSSVMFRPSGVGVNLSAVPVGLRMPDVPVGTLIFGRCWVFDENGATVSVFLGDHEFDEFNE